MLRKALGDPGARWIETVPKHGYRFAGQVNPGASAEPARIGAVGNERIPAYLFLPKNAKPPYQVMVGVSGANVFSERSSATTTDVDRFTFIVRSGRAFLYPVDKSTFERGDRVLDDTPTMTADYRDDVVMWSKDLAYRVHR